MNTPPEITPYFNAIWASLNPGSTDCQVIQFRLLLHVRKELLQWELMALEVEGDNVL